MSQLVILTFADSAVEREVTMVTAWEDALLYSFLLFLNHRDNFCSCVSGRGRADRTGVWAADCLSTRTELGEIFKIDFGQAGFSTVWLVEGQRDLWTPSGCGATAVPAQQTLCASLLYLSLLDRHAMKVTELCEPHCWWWVSVSSVSVAAGNVLLHLTTFITSTEWTAT